MFFFLMIIRNLYIPFWDVFLVIHLASHT